MKCFIQFYDESGNHAAPYDLDDGEQCASLKDAKAAFEAWVDEVGQYAEPQNASALVYLGEGGGDYPDYAFAVGPRGGINRASC